MRRSLWAVLVGVFGGVVPIAAQAEVQVDINRPRSPLECDMPIGETWYGSTERCLDELRGGRNVTNEWLPPILRRRYGYRWSPIHERALRAVTLAIRAGLPALPGVARTFPHARRALGARWRPSRRARFVSLRRCETVRAPMIARPLRSPWLPSA